MCAQSQMPAIIRARDQGLNVYVTRRIGARHQSLSIPATNEHTHASCVCGHKVGDARCTQKRVCVCERAILCTMAHIDDGACVCARKFWNHFPTTCARLSLWW